MDDKPYLSIVIPLYNEVESIPEMYAQLTGVLEQYGHPYEIIVIDDGSKDGSFDLLKHYHEEDPRFKIIRFRRNFGQTAGFAAGFDLAQGEWVVTMDADLQNDPADIPRLVDKAENEGYDIVSGWRVNRQDTYLSRKLPSKIANRMISDVTGVHLHDYGCSLKVYHRDVVKNINLYGEMHRFIPALASRIGVTVGEEPVNHRARQYGKSKYGISRTVRVFLDLMTVRFLLSFDTRPIHVFGSIGLVTLGLGVLIGLYLTLVKLLFGQNIGDRPLLWLAVLLVIVGIQFISTGLLAEVLARTYYEAQGKTIYVIREVLADPPVVPVAHA